MRAQLARHEPAVTGTSLVDHSRVVATSQQSRGAVSAAMPFLDYRPFSGEPRSRIVTVSAGWGTA